MRKFLALFAVVVLTAGCSIAPVRYVPVYYSTQTQGRLVMPQAPTGETATAPAATASAPVQVAPVVIIQSAPVYVQPPIYYNPLFDVAAGYLIWRGIVGGHSGHHHRR